MEATDSTGQQYRPCRRSGVSEAQNSYSKENALTPSLKVSAYQNGYGSSIPPSRRMTENFSHGSKNEDDVSMQRIEEQPRQHSVFCTGSTITGTLRVLSNAEKAGDNTGYNVGIEE